jgi:hypothetical protein
MSQTPTAHPPLPTPDLPLGDQVLLRLDEIIGLLDRIASTLEDCLPLGWEELLVAEDDLDALLVANWLDGSEDLPQ